MPYSPLQSIRRYQSISMFGGGILVTVLVLIACALGMASIVYGHIEAGRRNFVSGKEQTLDEIKTSETSFRNGVANTQLIWREISRAPDSVVEAFFGNEQRIAIKPYPSLVVGVPGQTGSRAEVSRYLALSILLSCICAASSINRGRLLEGYHYSTRAGVFGLVPTMDEDRPALATPERRARVLDALRIDFGDERPPAAGERPRDRWLPPYVGPVAGQVRIRIAARAYADGAPFAVLVAEYAPLRAGRRAAHLDETRDACASARRARACAAAARLARAAVTHGWRRQGRADQESALHDEKSSMHDRGSDARNNEGRVPVCIVRHISNQPRRRRPCATWGRYSDCCSISRRSLRNPAGNF